MAKSNDQTWNPEQYAHNARFVADLATPVIEWLNPQPGETILDVGCGDGHLTEKLTKFGCDVIAVDSSLPQVEAARQLGLKAYPISAQDVDKEIAFLGAFDAVFSNATLHWVHPPEAAIKAAFRALKPKGRFVGEFGGEGCIATIREALSSALKIRGIDIQSVDPWFFPSAHEYRLLLEENGFHVERCVVIPRPTLLPHTVREWLQTFGLCFLSALPETDHDAFLDEVTSMLKPKLCDALGKWTADYTRLRFMASKP